MEVAKRFYQYREHRFFNQYNGPKPELYRRYIDDCIDATSSAREELRLLNIPGKFPILV